ncbi:hypothetical protein niasHT_015006 [Heterodera trifolii]|uniref:Uncharacterized protein n=1 Tax=Heterodera trifolii TaxID=157864 RepID=A0ABD2L0T3_9BILA
MEAENVPPQNELEKLEREALDSKKSKSRSHEERLKNEIAQMMGQLREAMKEEVRGAVEELWAKTEPLLLAQKRSTDALTEAFDEFTSQVHIAGRSMDEERADNQQSSDNPSENDGETDPPVSGEPNPQVSGRPNPPVSGEPVQASSLPPEQPNVNVRYTKVNIGAPQRGGRGQWGPPGCKGPWKAQGPAPKHQKRVGYLMRQLERELKEDQAPEVCMCWSCRRGKWSGDRGGRGGGMGRGHRGAYGRGRTNYQQHAGPSHCGH